MSRTSPDWPALERLRDAFLNGSAGRQDYWQSATDLESYEATFGQRIAWKWRHVLDELTARGWSCPAGPVLDWGCGPGTAGREFLRWPGGSLANALHCWDRSPLAMRYASDCARAEFPNLAVEAGQPPAPGTVLISHVLTELNPGQLESLLATVEAAQAIIWVEPGTHEASRLLLTVRERLRRQYQLVAPCPHQGPCGLLAVGQERHWCHHFAPSPPEVFTDGCWAHFARELGIDRRSLPLSYLALDRRPAPPLPEDAVRLIGRPRVYKAHALLFGCHSNGVHDQRLTRRQLPDQFRQLRKGNLPSLQRWQCAGDEVVGLRPP